MVLFFASKLTFEFLIERRERLCLWVERLALFPIRISCIKWLETCDLISGGVIHNCIFPSLLENLLTDHSRMLLWLIWMRFIFQRVLFALRDDWDLWLNWPFGLHILSCLSRTISSHKIVEHLKIDLDKARCQRIGWLRWITGRVTGHLSLFHRSRNFLASSLLTYFLSLGPCRYHLEQRICCQFYPTLRWNLCVLNKTFLWALWNGLFCTSMVMYR